MARRLRRLVVLAALAAVVAVVLRRRDAHTISPWPDPAPATGAGTTPRTAARQAAKAAPGPAAAAPAASQPDATWVAPVDGECPSGFPIKANDSSHIFHVPGGRSYDRTMPERCYRDAESAAADGYRQAKH